MATRGIASTEVDSPLAPLGNPTPPKLQLGGSDGQGFRPLGMTTAATAVDTTMSLGPARPSPGAHHNHNHNQNHNHATLQLSPLQHFHPGHFPGSHAVALQGHLSSPHLAAQRPQALAANPRAHPLPHPHHAVQMASGAVAKAVSRSHGDARRREGPTMESRAHPIVTRPVANMGSPAAGLKPQGLLLHRPQGSPQDKAHLQKPSPVAQRQVVQRAHTRTASWQAPLAQHTPGTPSAQSRMFPTHQALSAQHVRLSPQEQQARQHPALPQHFSQQPQLRDLGSSGAKSVPVYPVLRTPVAGNHSNNHADTAYRERLSDSQIVVHIGDRKVRLVSESDPSSLYSLCRRWVRNDVPRADRTGVRDVMNMSLPKPLSFAEIDNAGDYALDNGTRSDHEQCQPEIVRPVHATTNEELLESHVQHFKTVRKRSKEERMRRIARFKPRLALLLPGNESG